MESSTLTAAAAPTATPLPVCLLEGGKTQQLTFHSDTLEETFTFSVYTPPCYDETAPDGYPIIYLFHGQNMDDTYWPDTLGITRLADEAIRSGRTPFLMVFPYEVHNWEVASESKFGDAVVHELFPWVESHYDICMLRQCQAIGGISRGGGWAMHIGLTNFDKFGSIGAHSFGYFSGDLYRIQGLLTTHAVTDFPRIYIDRGKNDYIHESIDDYEQNLTATGVAHEYHVSPGIHDVAYWKSQVQNYLDWYLEGFDAIPGR